jgi:hypothetical protein
MARILENPRAIHPMLLSVFLMLLLASPIYSQSTPTNRTPAEAKPQAIRGTDEPNQAPKADAKAELLSPATTEEMRQAQIETDAKKLYQLSVDLRAEVAKTYKESLSVTVLKKAQEVEKLAKRLKAEMNLEVAAAKH